MKKLLLNLITFILIFTFVFNHTKQIKANTVGETSNTLKQEFRAAWISYYTGDIRFTSIKDYKNSIDKILDTLEYYNMNAMIFHVRANHDAWYNSKINRINQQLKNLDFNEFDPLEYVITEAHKRGIEFHAWLNPYRIGSTYDTKEEIAKDFSNFPNNPASNPDNVLIGNPLQILDPGIPENRQFIIDTCLEIVENYDVDAIHFDDYFYANGINDYKTVEKYNTNNLSVADFRRLQVDTFIYDLKQELDSFNQKNHRYVQLGISPTGVYKNAATQNEANTPLDEYVYNQNGDLIYPTGATLGCQMHYESYLYCDTLKWVNNEWINYILPQTYWASNHRLAPYQKLISWWNAAVKNKNVNLYSGMGIYMWLNQTNEACNQLEIVSNLDQVFGTSIYSFKQMQLAYDKEDANARKQMEQIKTNYWSNKTIPPQITGFQTEKIGSVENFSEFENTISFSKLDNAKFYIIYRTKDKFTYKEEEIAGIIGSNQNYITWTDSVVGDYEYNVIPVSFTNNLGDPVSKISKEDTVLLPFELYQDANLQSKYYFDYALSLKLGNNIYIKQENNLNQFIWESTNQEVATIDEQGKIQINHEGTTKITGKLKTDQKQIVQFTLNIYLGDTINNYYNVNFYDYDGTLLKSEQVQYGTSANAPTDLKREPGINCTYEFYGWSGDYQNITSDVDFYALYSTKMKVFTVTFKNPDGTILKEEKVIYGKYATAPQNPQMEPTIEYTYTFLNWDKDFNNVTEDLVVNAVYYTIDNLYKISYETFDGSIISSNFYYFYEEIDEPTTTKEGYIFDGWFYDQEFNQKAVFPIKLTKNTVLYAKWTKIINLNFYDQNNNLFKTFKLKSGDVLDDVPVISQTGYTFEGWKINDTLFDFTQPLYQDTDFKAALSQIIDEPPHIEKKNCKLFSANLIYFNFMLAITLLFYKKWYK